MDYNPEMSFDAVKVTTLFRSMYEELGRKFIPWTDDMVEKTWTQIHNEHDDVRAFIGEILAFSQNVKVCFSNFHCPPFTVHLPWTVATEAQPSDP